MDEYELLSEITLDVGSAADLIGLPVDEVGRRIGESGGIRHVTVQGYDAGARWIIWSSVEGPDRGLAIYDVVAQPAG